MASQKTSSAQRSPRSDVRATKSALAPGHIAELDAASALPPEYPGWMVEWQDRNRRPANTL